MDVCGSTEAKQNVEPKKWITFLRNSLLANIGLPLLEEPLKVIGDELMFFVSDHDLFESEENYYTLLDSVKTAISSWPNVIDNFVLNIKGAINYCSEVYPISFMGTIDNPVKDYYGIEIDLTSRLMSVSQEKRLVVSDSFYVKSCEINQEETMKLLKESCNKQLKGFSTLTKYWYVDIM